MFSRIKIGCRNSHRNMLDFFMAHQTKTFVYDLQKSGKYDEYVNGLKNSEFSCEDFIPVDKLDFVAYICPVDSKSILRDESVRARKKIDYVIDRLLQISFNVHLTEVELFDGNTKSLLLAMTFSFVLEYLLQMNQDIDLVLSKSSVDYLLSSLYDRVISRFFISKEYGNKKLSYMKSLLYKSISNNKLVFETVNSWNKIQNICECVIEDDTLIVMFEMPRTVV